MRLPNLNITTIDISTTSNVLLLYSDGTTARADDLLTASEFAGEKRRYDDSQSATTLERTFLKRTLGPGTGFPVVDDSPGQPQWCKSSCAHVDILQQRLQMTQILDYTWWGRCFPFLNPSRYVPIGGI